MSGTTWVVEGQRVEARFATGDGAYATGRVVSYTDQPTVTIITDDGRHVNWIAGLCVPLDTPLHDLREERNS